MYPPPAPLFLPDIVDHWIGRLPSGNDCYITNWRITMLFMGKSTSFRLGHFRQRTVSQYQRVIRTSRIIILANFHIEDLLKLIPCDPQLSRRGIERDIGVLLGSFFAVDIVW